MQKLTNEEFKNIYTCENFRNKVAFANKHLDVNSCFKYYATCDYPRHKERQVTAEQIKEAQELRTARAKEVLKENKHKLLFVCMGGEFEAEKGYINTHRMRSEFLNSDGKKFFIEVATARDEKEMVITHSIDRDLEDKFKKRLSFYSDKIKAEQESENSPQKIKQFRKDKEKYFSQPYNNYKNLERLNRVKYTYSEVLKIVNKNFNCNFNEIVIDYTNLTCDGVICESPKF